ncbi:MAG: hypothetical protein GY713_20120 [Actinomycetia bacterium]|nr:hypothetical protein [Actinomycetes bacterium]
MAITEPERLHLLEGFRGTLDEEQLAILSEVVHTEFAAVRSEMSTEFAAVRTEIANNRYAPARDLRFLVGTQLATMLVVIGSCSVSPNGQFVIVGRPAIVELAPGLGHDVAQLGLEGRGVDIDPIVQHARAHARPFEYWPCTQKMGWGTLAFRTGAWLRPTPTSTLSTSQSINGWRGER